jgi:hypothetical protein
MKTGADFAHEQRKFLIIKWKTSWLCLIWLNNGQESFCDDKNAFLTINAMNADPAVRDCRLQLMHLKFNPVIVHLRINENNKNDKKFVYINTFVSFHYLIYYQ